MGKETERETYMDSDRHKKEDKGQETDGNGDRHRQKTNRLKEQDSEESHEERQRWKRTKTDKKTDKNIFRQRECRHTGRETEETALRLVKEK